MLSPTTPLQCSSPRSPLIRSLRHDARTCCGRAASSILTPVITWYRRVLSGRRTASTGRTAGRVKPTLLHVPGIHLFHLGRHFPSFGLPLAHNPSWPNISVTTYTRPYSSNTGRTAAVSLLWPLDSITLHSKARNNTRSFPFGSKSKRPKGFPSYALGCLFSSEAGGWRPAQQITKPSNDNREGLTEASPDPNGWFPARLPSLSASPSVKGPGREGWQHPISCSSKVRYDPDLCDSSQSDSVGALFLV